MMPNSYGTLHGPKPPHDLLATLREATAAAHRRIDAAFGSLTLHDRRGFARFLSAHAVGLGPCFRIYRAFVETELDRPCPDYPGLIQADLDALGIDSGELPVLPRPAAVNGQAGAIGMAYVVTGSRLGLGVIRDRGYWGEAAGFRSRYLEDSAGAGIWKTLVQRLKSIRPDAPAAARTEAAALATFTTFERAFAATAGKPGHAAIAGANG